MSDVVLPEGVQAVVDDANQAASMSEGIAEEAKPKPTKLEQKRQQILMDRIRRKMGEGMTEQQAMQSVAQEDYNRLPVDKKLLRLETMVTNTVRQIANDILALRQNDSAIAEAFDINYKAIEKAFAKLGLSPQEQMSLIDEARREVMEERQRALQERLAAQRKAQEDSEKARIEAEARLAESKPVGDSPVPEGQDPHVQEGATVFGG